MPGWYRQVQDYRPLLPSIQETVRHSAFHLHELPALQPMFHTLHFHDHFAFKQIKGFALSVAMQWCSGPRIALNAAYRVTFLLAVFFHQYRDANPEDSQLCHVLVHFSPNIVRISVFLLTVLGELSSREAMKPSKEGMDRAECTLGFLLQRPYGYIQRNSYGKLAELGHPEVRPSHSAVFRHLQVGGQRISHLAAASGMTKQSMGYLVEGLRKEGYVRLDLDAEDARAKRVCLTPKGKAVIEELRLLSFELEQCLAAEFGQEWVDGLRGKLSQLTQFLNIQGS